MSYELMMTLNLMMALFAIVYATHIDADLFAFGWQFYFLACMAEILYLPAIVVLVCLIVSVILIISGAFCFIKSTKNTTRKMEIKEGSPPEKTKPPSP